MKIPEKLQKYKGYLPVVILVIVAMITLVVIVAVELTRPGEDMGKFQNDLETANTLYESKDYSEALIAYRDASEQFPKHIESYTGMIQILVDKNLLSTAEEIADSAKERVGQTESTVLFLMIGNAYYVQEDYAKAADLYTKAYECNNQSKAVLIANAKVNIKLNKLDEAREFLDISDDNSDEFYESVLLKSYLWLDDTDMADGQLTGIAGEDLGTTEINDRYASFRTIIDKIKAESPDDIYKATLLSKEYINAGYPYLAIALLEPKKDLIGEYWDGLYFLGRAYFDVGEYDKAITELEAAIEISPQAPEVFLIIARSNIEKNETTSVEENYEKAISYASGTEKMDYLKEYYQYLYSVELYNKAVTTLNQIEAISDSAWLRLKYLEVYHLQKDYEKMKFHLDALTVMPMSQAEKEDYYSFYINYAFETEELALANDMLDDFKDLNQTAPEMNYLYGRYYFLMGDPGQSKIYLENAIEYDLEGYVSQEAKKLLAKV